MIENRFSFNLFEIASWQLKSQSSRVKLPALQRSFVWKVNQIESLWDSIFRGFPIGSFLLSKYENGDFDLLDGQQRSTSITLGLNDPWHVKVKEDHKFWSLNNIPVVWIDIAPKEKTSTQKFVFRVVTQSHPWGYQRVNNRSILSVSDRKNALSIFRKNPENKSGSYIQLSCLNIFPYDSDLPVPLHFVIKSILENGERWVDGLVTMCKNNLPIDYIKTKHSGNDNRSYLDRLNETLHDKDFDNILTAIKNIEQIEIPGIVVKKEILKAEDEQTGEDPTLFVRLNSSGTPIAGEELIYSIYKASFPQAKELVENIGASFIPPSHVIGLVSRLALSEINEGSYPSPISVNDFRKQIQDELFKSKLKELIGENEETSAAKVLFVKAFEILESKNDFTIPPVLVKTLVKHSPDLFLMLLQWLKLSNYELNTDLKRRILATTMALSWFCNDNTKYVRYVWNSLQESEFWNKQVFSDSHLNERELIMYPLICPSSLREHLIQAVVEKNVYWENLYPAIESKIAKIYREILSHEIKQESEIVNSIKQIWRSFINKLFWNKSFILFAQRKYINKNFGEFNQMETLQDSNTPWDWDHIYPLSWVYGKWNINQNTRHWTNSIGNFRAISLEENRSDNNKYSPKERLCDEKEDIDVREDSFIKISDGTIGGK